MVSPIYLIAVALLVAFLLGIADRIGRGLSLGLTLGTLAWMVGLSAVWLVSLLSGAAPTEVFTAGFAPPFSINLRLGAVEAGLATFVNLAFLGSAVVLTRRLLHEHMGAQVLLLMMAMGTNGLILTRDLFNVFVFLEITAIATYGMIALHDDERGLSAGFKYVIAGGLSSALFLIGTIYLYRLTGTLNIDGMVEAVGAAEGFGAAAADSASAGGLSSGVLSGGAGFAAIFLLVLALLIELKPFPANGWALDVYQGASPAVAAVISVATSGGILAALYKVLPLIPANLLAVLAGVGALTFGVSNLLGLRQTNARRMLGYSSVAQIGLIVAVLSFARMQGWGDALTLLVAGGVLLNHLLAKGGLFWIAAIRDLTSLDGMARKLAGRRGLLVLAGVLVAALAGLPPFPAFWAKWTMIGRLLGAGQFLWIVVILAGSLFEAAYLFRFLAAGTTSEALRFSVVSEGGAARELAGGRVAPLPRTAGSAADLSAVTDLAYRGRTVASAAPGLFAVLVLMGGLVGAWLFGFRELLIYLPLLAGVGLWVLDWLPAKIKALVSVAAMLAYGWLVYPLLGGIGLTFLGIFVAGGAVVVLAMINRTKRAAGLFPMTLTLLLSMAALLAAESSLGFFVAFETMTLSSYVLLLRRPSAVRAAQRYLLFSLGGAFLLMVGLILLAQAGVQLAPPHIAAAPLLPAAVGDLAILGSAGSAAPSTLATVGALPGTEVPMSAIVLIALGFLAKAGAVGVHIWLPGTYAEAEDDVSPIFSAVLSKVPVLGIFLVALVVLVGAGVSSGAGLAGESLLAAIGWIGAATALFGALLAVYQQDVKYLLAYSSMSQLGYILLAVAIGTQLGWTTGLYLSVLHFVFKGMLFLSVGGVVLRSGTRNFRELGGLIKRMPFSFISSLMAIIAVSGVPPLAGFGGKWMLYTALFERGWYFQGAVAFFASTIAFLYLFKFIHTVFLGQLKDEHREIKEAPIWLILPQMLLAVGLMIVSMFPNVILQPLLAVTGAHLGSTTGMDGHTVLSTLGYWNGNLVMYVTMAVFMLPLVWLMVVMRRPQKVQQFNIVYAAERPERPETTHFAHAFFWHYDKALGFLSRPGVIAFWNGVRETVEALASAIRRLYSGNGQTYALHIVLFVVALYLIAGGLS